MATLEIESTEDKISFTKQGNAVPLNNNGIEAYTFTDSKASLNALYYRIKSNETNGNIKYSSITKVGAVTDINAGFSIYPNPVIEGKLNIRFTNQVSGIYVINVWDNKGQLIHREKINVNDLHSLKTVSLNPAVAAGSYRVTLTDNAGNKTTVPFIVP